MAYLGSYLPLSMAFIQYPLYMILHELSLYRRLAENKCRLFIGSEA
jgi:hypothetical protein